jgi:hypothetical protein
VKPEVLLQQLELPDGYFLFHIIAKDTRRYCKEKELKEEDSGSRKWKLKHRQC